LSLLSQWIFHLFGILYTFPRRNFPNSYDQFDITRIDLNDENLLNIENLTNAVPADYTMPQEWTICTNVSFNHPYHQGVHPFQIVSFPDSNQPFENTGLLAGMWRDTVPISNRACVIFRFWAQAWNKFPGFVTLLIEQDASSKFTFQLQTKKDLTLTNVIQIALP